MHLESVVMIWRLKGDNIAHIHRYRFLRLELFKSIAMQDRNVYSIAHCDRFVYLMNNDNVKIIKAVFFYQVLTGIGHTY